MIWRLRRQPRWAGGKSVAGPGDRASAVMSARSSSSDFDASVRQDASADKNKVYGTTGNLHRCTRRVARPHDPCCWRSASSVVPDAGRATSTTSRQADDGYAARRHEHDRHRRGDAVLRAASGNDETPSCRRCPGCSTRPGPSSPWSAGAREALALPLVLGSTLLFLIGMAFCYFFVFGMVFKFIAEFAPKSNRSGA